jgi:hypothetical protein
MSHGVADVSVNPELHEIEIERTVVMVVLHFFFPVEIVHKKGMAYIVEIYKAVMMMVPFV